MIVGIGEFIFPKAPRAHHQPIIFATHPNDREYPRELLPEVLAIRAQRLDTKNSILVNRVSHRETAGQVTEIFQARLLGELEPCVIDPGDRRLDYGNSLWVTGWLG